MQVLHTPLTTSTEAHKRDEGRLAVQLNDGQGEPTPEQLKLIEELANRKIDENVEIKVFKMDR